MRLETITSPRLDSVVHGARRYTTEEAAAVLHIRAQTLRSALCRSGHYFGVRPWKAANRYLFWPAEAIDQLACGEVTQ